MGPRPRSISYGKLNFAFSSSGKDFINTYTNGETSGCLENGDLTFTSKNVSSLVVYVSTSRISMDEKDKFSINGTENECVQKVPKI